MATIKAIEARTVHQIQSGQVIVDLCSVVKEIVENSVDAGASNIEVRFKNQGLDSIEVQDNGSGISPQNYETLALKHYTSKLSTYEDLTTLETFGFRGEALSSLCALSKFSVITCLASDTPKGSKLEFETSGKLQNTSVVAAQKGTTVFVESLFKNLPVRRRELERNIKREWNRVIGVLNQYACILTGVKFTVSQQPNKGKKVVLFSTKGNGTTRENIVNVFGAKTLNVLIPLDLELELEPTSGPSQRWSAQEDGGTKEIRVRGHVSRPAHGEGRQTPDRQMFFVNGRPCGLPQFAKVFNEVYKSYNSSQAPFICANIQLDTHMYDVNVSPDKRTILLHDQSRMLDNLRESLVALFEAQDYSVPVSQLGGSKQTPFKKLTISRQGTVDSDGGDQDKSSRGSKEPDVHSQASRRDEPVSDDDENERSAKEQEGRRLKKAVSTRPIAQSGQGLNLVSRWIERKSDDRSDSTSNSVSPAAKSPDGDVSKSKEKLVAKFAHANRQNEKDDPPVLLSEKAADISGLGTDSKLIEPSGCREDTDSEGNVIETDTAEPSIPSISTPSRTATITSNILSPSRFKKRTAPDVALITVGNNTITRMIGPPGKRPRIEKSTEVGSRRRTSFKQSAKDSANTPSFRGRLSQIFSASSTTNSVNMEDLGGSTDADEDDDSNRSESSSDNLFVRNNEEEAADDVPQNHEEDNRSTHEQDRCCEAHSPTADEEVEEDATSERHPGAQSGDDDCVYEDEKKAQEENKVQSMIDAAEDAGKTSSEETHKRQQSFIKGTTRRKDATSQLVQRLRLDEKHIRDAVKALDRSVTESVSRADAELGQDNIDAADAEEKLSLTISKSDFGKMKIVGQFNLGFILAVRAAATDLDEMEDQQRKSHDEMFIIDQHATDEKYNFERLQATTVVQSQRLVQPKMLELTAIEEEVIKENMEALEANGFMVSMDESGYQPVGSRCQLLSLPLSRETTFSLADLEELVSLLTEHQSVSSNTIPRPSKVRKMFAMRACRSSVMIGKSLPVKQMEKLVRHMGELDKPWNCPHGRPTMRHVCGLGAWDDLGWREGDGFDGSKAEPTDWAEYIRKNGEEKE